MGTLKLLFESDQRNPRTGRWQGKGGAEALFRNHVRLYSVGERRVTRSLGNLVVSECLHDVKNLFFASYSIHVVRSLRRSKIGLVMNASITSPTRLH